MARLLACLILALLPAAILSGAEPEVTSVFPFAATPGSCIRSDIRGSALEGARALVFEDAGLGAKVSGFEAKVAHAEFTVAPTATPGWHSFRVVTRAGVTNSLRFMVVNQPVLTGQLAHSGDVATHWLDAKSGDTLTVETVSGYKSFDPTLTLLEETTTWFEPHHLTRLAFNDDPLPFPGLSTDPRLSYKFTHAGKYCVQVGSLDGKGGPDYVYLLRVSHQQLPPPTLHPAHKAGWEERQFTRTITNDWLQQLALRGGLLERPSPPETFRAVPEGSTEIPIITPPAVVEGRIDKPGETQLIRLNIEKPQDLAIEIETPQATLPRFNPVVRLLQPDGYEFATDVYTKLNNNGLYMMKMIEPKAAFSLRSTGVYTLKIRDITTGCAGADFVYRLLVRNQVPHVGAVDVPTDHLNLEPGAVKPISIQIDREEGFAGYVTVNVKNLPAGVSALQAMENPEEKPPLPNGGRAERYFAKDQPASIAVAVAADAPITPMPVKALVEISVVNKGKLGPVIATREIPIMVVEHRP